MRAHATILLTALVILAAPVTKARCKYMVQGDLNHDCRIDFGDFAMLASRWLADCIVGPESPHCRCDIEWTAEPPMYEGRDQFAGGVVEGKIYVFGGNGNPKTLRSTEMYDPSTWRWKILADNNHISHGVEELTSAVVGGKLYVFGAHGGSLNEMYDPETDTWTTLARKPTTVASAPCTVYNGKIYVFGGYWETDDPARDRIRYDVVECYDPSTDSWHEATRMPRTISNFGIATVGTKAYLLGGSVGSEPPDIQLLDDVISYDFETNTWTTTGYTRLPMKKAYGYSHAAPVIDGEIYLIGGWESVEGDFPASRRVDVYDSQSNTWHQETPLPLPLGSHLSLNISDKLYILGGCHREDWDNRSKAEVISLQPKSCTEHAIASEVSQ